MFWRSQHPFTGYLPTANFKLHSKLFLLAWVILTWLTNHQITKIKWKKTTRLKIWFLERKGEVQIICFFHLTTTTDKFWNGSCTYTPVKYNKKLILLSENPVENTMATNISRSSVYDLHTHFFAGIHMSLTLRRVHHDGYTSLSLYIIIVNIMCVTTSDVKFFFIRTDRFHFLRSYAAASLNMCYNECTLFYKHRPSVFLFIASAVSNCIGCLEVLDSCPWRIIQHRSLEFQTFVTIWFLVGVWVYIGVWRPHSILSVRFLFCWESQKRTFRVWSSVSNYYVAGN